MSLWLYQIVKQRVAATGMQEWRVVETLMQAGLEAEANAIEAKRACDQQIAIQDFPPDHSRLDPHGAYRFAAICIPECFQGDEAWFMRTLSNLNGDRQTLIDRQWSRIWRKWSAKEEVPPEYLPAIHTLKVVTHGMEQSLLKKSHRTEKLIRS
ncbi:MAG TPA: hypothetical protein VJ549_04505, partial [Geothrix sp.]|nr:hypothetical protein [Geothrix sp.]